MFGSLRKMLEGAAAQVNPFDGGKTYKSVTQTTPPARRALTPSRRDFPNRTNYGVPEDNMIDTPGGYVTEEQYNTMMGPSKQMPIWARPHYGFGQANYAGYEDLPSAPVQSAQAADRVFPSWQGAGSPNPLQGAQQFYTGQLTRPGASLQGMQGSDTGYLSDDIRRRLRVTY